MQSEKFDEALRALTHPDRRKFVRACLTVERAAGDLAALSGLSLATVSEHLKVLRKSGLLQLDRKGRFWMYRTNTNLLNKVTDELAKIGGT